MSYPGLINDYPTESREREHQEYHIAENEFVDKCIFCQVERCHECKGTGMTNQCALVCWRCDGRGRII